MFKTVFCDYCDDELFLADAFVTPHDDPREDDYVVCWSHLLNGELDEFGNDLTLGA